MTPNAGSGTKRMYAPATWPAPAASCICGTGRPCGRRIPSRESDWQSTEGVEQQVSFELVTGDIGQDGAEQRYLSRLTLRLDAACASTVEVALSYDGGPWETVASLTAREARRSYDLPLVPRRHSTLRLRLRGKGQITLRSLAKNLAAAKGGLVEEQEEATWQV